jgi:hypothetical protein
MDNKTSQLLNPYPIDPIKITISKTKIEKEPYLIWNAFVDICFNQNINDLTSKQRISHLAFIYDGEIQNGGHLQYFENKGVEYLEETLEALDTLNAKPQKEILLRASQKYLSKERSKIVEVNEMVEQALLGEYDQYDKEYYECKPNLVDLLKKYLDKNLSEFVIIK